MERNRGPVKKPRRYHSTRRQQQARLTREAILDAARRRFLDDGYTATTIAAIAGDAGVSVDTIYKTFGGKPGLVRAICEQGPRRPRRGARRGPLRHPSDHRTRSIRRSWAGSASSPPKSRPGSRPSCCSSATPPSPTPKWPPSNLELDDQRLERMTHNARNLADAGHLRPGLSVDDAGEIMWTYSSPELYELLIIDAAGATTDTERSSPPLSPPLSSHRRHRDGGRRSNTNDDALHPISSPVRGGAGASRIAGCRAIFCVPSKPRVAVPVGHAESTLTALVGVRTGGMHNGIYCGRCKGLSDLTSERLRWSHSGGRFPVCARSLT